jgi:hypothetical protein
VFGWGAMTDGLLKRMFSDETQVTQWLAGGAAHPPETPSDRAR